MHFFHFRLKTSDFRLNWFICSILSSVSIQLILLDLFSIKCQRSFQSKYFLKCATLLYFVSRLFYWPGNFFTVFCCNQKIERLSEKIVFVRNTKGKLPMHIVYYILSTVWRNYFSIQTN